MPSRQERRKAERDAAKRAPAQTAAAGAAGAAGAAAALANLGVNPGGDWTTQQGDPDVLLHALGVKILIQRAGAGDREAQWSLGYSLMKAGGVAGTPLGAADRTPMADVGLALCTNSFRSLHRLGCVDVGKVSPGDLKIFTW